MKRFLSPFLALSLLATPALAGTALADVTVDTGKSSARGQGDVDVDVGRGGVERWTSRRTAIACWIATIAMTMQMTMCGLTFPAAM